VADGWCWFVLREEYCWLVAGGWFVVREKYCWLVADKPSEQGDSRAGSPPLIQSSSWWWRGEGVHLFGSLSPPIGATSTRNAKWP
jgi:hypothetical protein